MTDDEMEIPVKRTAIRTLPALSSIALRTSMAQELR
jgi:hypothetical protein